MRSVAIWACRICFAIVFAINVQCALSYVIAPADYVAGFQLAGVEGEVAVRGIGIAFFMWNATYPAFIVDPQRFKVLGFVILAQQIIGLVGECALYLSLPVSGFALLSASIMRFIAFDAIGLILMMISFIAFCLSKKD